MICNLGLGGGGYVETERRRILLEQGVRTLVRHGYPRFIRLALRIISLDFGHRGVCDVGV